MTLNLTLKIAEFPDAVWQEGSPRRGEENKKKFIRIGRPVPEQFRVILEGRNLRVGACPPPHYSRWSLLLRSSRIIDVTAYDIKIFRDDLATFYKMSPH